MKPEGREDQLEAAEHWPATDFAERAERKLQPAASLAARSVNEAQFAVGQQEAGRHAGRCSAARFFRRPRRSSQRATNRVRSRPLLASPKPKTAATHAKSVQIPPARSRNWSRAKSNKPRLSRRKRLHANSLPREGPPAAPAPPAAGQAVPNQAMPRVAMTAPPGSSSTIAAASQRAGQSGAADVTAAASRAHLAAAPLESAEANSTAAVTPPVLGSGYTVQVTSERSESSAQAAFRALQAKYPNQLSGRQPIIRRADLGAAGIYYRALIGPFASAEKAAKLCRRLRAAGGDCIIQKN